MCLLINIFFLNIHVNLQTICDMNQVRDYIHVMDVADGHIAALRKLLNTENIGEISSSFHYK